MRGNAKLRRMEEINPARTGRLLEVINWLAPTVVQVGTVAMNGIKLGRL